MPQKEQPVLVTAAQMARRLNISKHTFDTRAERIGLAPDAILDNGCVFGGSPLFDVARMEHLRRAILEPSTQEVCL